MFLKNAKFDHDTEHVSEGFGIDEDLLSRCKERIYFTNFSASLRSIELYPSRDLAPKNLTTITGNLEYCLSLINDEKEYEITLLYFMQYQQHANAAFAHYVFRDENNTHVDEKDRIKYKLTQLMKKLKDDEDDVKEQEDKIQELIKRIEAVKKSNHDFSKYLQIMGLQNYKEVDEILKNVFFKD